MAKESKKVLKYTVKLVNGDDLRKKIKKVNKLLKEIDGFELITEIVNEND